MDIDAAVASVGPAVGRAAGAEDTPQVRPKVVPDSPDRGLVRKARRGTAEATYGQDGALQSGASSHRPEPSQQRVEVDLAMARRRLAASLARAAASVGQGDVAAAAGIDAQNEPLPAERVDHPLERQQAVKQARALRALVAASAPGPEDAVVLAQAYQLEAHATRVNTSAAKASVLSGPGPTLPEWLKHEG